MTTLELPPELEERLCRAAEASGKSKSDYLRDLVAEKLVGDEGEDEGNGQALWEAWKKIPLEDGSGNRNLARDRKKILKEIFRKKHESRSR